LWQTEQHIVTSEINIRLFVYLSSIYITFTDVHMRVQSRDQAVPSGQWAHRDTETYVHY